VESICLSPAALAVVSALVSGLFGYLMFTMNDSIKEARAERDRALSGWEATIGLGAVPPMARKWGPRWYVALSAIVANATLCLVWAGFIVIGLIAMQFPPPPPNPDQSVSNMWAGWVLIAMEALLAGVQAWHLWVRGRVEQATRSAP
jgi:hypothetical protein